MKQNLLIIPAGPTSLFQNWNDYSKFNFDTAIISWSNTELQNTQYATYKENISGQKWRIVSEFVKLHDLSQYEYIWVLDDDCLTTPEGIDATFNFCKEHNLDLSQPALTPDSFGTHPSSYLIPGAKFHITNTVEIMCPIFSQQAWVSCSEHFGLMPLGVGYGLEGHWTHVLDSETGTTKFGGQVAVIDMYPVKHTKPVAGPGDYARMGIDPNNDGMYFYNLNPIDWSFKTLGVIKNETGTLKDLYSELSLRYDPSQTGSGYFTDKGTDHTYMDFYGQYFSKYKSDVKLLEIGIMSGGSVYLYSKYFKKYDLTAIDLNNTFFFEQRPFHDALLNDPNIHLYFKTDSTDTEFTKDISDEKYDIIIDDGHHEIGTQLSTFKNWFPKTKKGGMYFIEDVPDGKGNELMSNVKAYLAENNINAEVNIWNGAIHRRIDDVIIYINKL